MCFIKIKKKKKSALAACPMTCPANSPIERHCGVLGSLHCNPSSALPVSCYWFARSHCFSRAEFIALLIWIRIE